MGFIGPVIAKGNLSTNHRACFAQVNEVVVATTGHEASQIINARTGANSDLGIPAPTAAPTNSNAAGVLTGTYIYRVRWRDSSTATNSLASSTLTLTLTAQTPTITRPGSPPSRVTHWILERTTDGGRTYYPVNRSSSAPDGTAIATTTFADTVLDATLRQRTSLPDTQGVPVPYRFCFSNQQRIFQGGGRVHRTTVTATNSSTAITAGSDFNSYMVGQDATISGEIDGATRAITAVGSATALTLASAYSGTTGTKNIAISGRRDIGAWSEANRPEEYGSAELSPNGLSNEIQIGSDGEPLTGGVGLGVQGVLWCKLTRMFFHSYTLNPNPVTGDGRVVEVPIRRGACGPKAVQFIDGWIYGIDLIGIWRMRPGGVPEDISGPISNDWKSNQLYFQSCDNWYISNHPVDQTVYFWVTLNTDEYPRHAYVWNTRNDTWSGSMASDVQTTSGIVLPDSRGIRRMCIYTKSTSGASSYLWAHGIGVCRGADKATNSPLYGTVTSATATSLTCSGAVWPTTDHGLTAVPISVINQTTGAIQQTVINDMLSTSSVQVPSWPSGTPTAGDTFMIGPISTVYRTGRISFGQPDKKMKSTEIWIWARYSSNSIPFKVRVYYDGSTTPSTDVAYTRSEDGVSWTASNAAFTVDPTVQIHHFRIPLGPWKRDIQLEIYSDYAGEPWTIYGIKLRGEIDESADPRR